MVSAERFIQPLAVRRGLAPCPAQDDRIPRLSGLAAAAKLLVLSDHWEKLLLRPRAAGFFACQPDLRTQGVSEVCDEC